MAGLGDKIKKLFGFGTQNEEFYEELEDTLLEADLGGPTTFEIVDKLKEAAKKGRIKSTDGLVEELKSILKGYIKTDSFEVSDDDVTVFLVLGVNGVGKTTSIAKMAKYYSKQKTPGKKIVLGAADTFRAAAIDQIKVHGDRLGFRVVSQAPGADPGAVLFDTLDSAIAKGDRLVLADTAGRMHNKENLIRELQKIHKIISGKLGEDRYKKILVIDSTTGQNGHRQVEIFHEAVGLDGIILSKYDSSAKGGTVVAICRDFGIPFLFRGTGESYDDLETFDADSFVENLIGR